MKRRLLNLAAAASLLLAVAIVGLWVRSRGRHESFSRTWDTSNEHRYWSIQSFYSSLDIQFTTSPHAGRPFPARYEYLDYTGREIPRPWFPFPPMQLQHFSIPGATLEVREITLTYWLVLAPTLVLPAIALMRQRRRRRRLACNLCAQCGYDRRAHAPTERCPECGSLPSGDAVAR